MTEDFALVVHPYRLHRELSGLRGEESAVEEGKTALTPFVGFSDEVKIYSLL